MEKDGRMLNTGYVLVKLFFRRNAPASATFMSHWCIGVACFLRSQTLLAADLPCVPLSHTVMSEVLQAAFQLLLVGAREPCASMSSRPCPSVPLRVDRQSTV